MKTLVLLSLLVALVFTTSTSAQNTIEGPDFVLEVEPNTENIFIVYEDEGEGTLRYTLKIRLTKETIRFFNDTEAQMQHSGPISAETIETMLGPFMEKMDMALKAAEKNCRLYKCKQIIFEPRFVVTMAPTKQSPIR